MVGQADFSNITQRENKNPLHVKESTACLFKEFDELLYFSGKQAKTQRKPEVHSGLLSEYN